MDKYGAALFRQSLKDELVAQLEEEEDKGSQESEAESKPEA
jgi:hypothetical protein